MKINNKYITCCLNGKPFVSHERAVQMVLDMGTRGFMFGKDVKKLAEQAELRVFKDKLVLFIFEDSFCPYLSNQVFVDGHLVDVRLEQIPSGKDYVCSFSGNVIFSEQKPEDPALREFIRKFLKKRIFDHVPSARELGLRAAYELFTKGKIQRRRLDCHLCL